MSKSYSFGPVAVWSKKSTTDWVFHPLSQLMSSADVRMIRPGIEVGQDSGNSKVRPALRMTNDGVNFDTPVAIGTDVQVGNGATFATDFVDMGTTTRTKNQFQAGVEVCNASGTSVEICRVMMRMDTREG